MQQSPFAQSQFYPQKYWITHRCYFFTKQGMFKLKNGWIFDALWWEKVRSFFSENFWLKVMRKWKKWSVKSGFWSLYTVKFRLSLCYPQGYPQWGKYAHSVDKKANLWNNLKLFLYNLRWTIVIDFDGYRPNVGIVICNRKGRCFGLNDTAEFVAIPARWN